MAGRPRQISEEFENLTTRDAILQAAEELAASVGPSGMKIREIARRVGIEPASIYNHFKGLGGVLSTLIHESLAEEYDLLDFPDDLIGEEAIREFNRRSTCYLAARKGIVSLSLNDFAEANSPGRIALDANEEGIVRGIDKEAEMFRKHLGLNAPDRAELGQIAIARRSMILVLLSMTWLNGREVDERREAEVAEIVSKFLLGLRSQY